ncbi:BgTH12-01006 [Blumeria graminis f. sp. triticale]|uniref:Bgt-917 n=2 Tax=Blumeria graminis TaxID=34373 RepID=A0A9X9QG42_BLUGR|nr:BgTH12-01006 [Blumeria graminis f. sp. triticale]VDB93652.1 Bgt-917 [Blumeria graminis f. sp. tritici]
MTRNIDNLQLLFGPGDHISLEMLLQDLHCLPLQ